MTQGDQVRALAVACLAEPRKGLEINHITMPKAPDPDSLSVGESFIPIHQRYDQRYIEGFHTDPDSDPVSVAAWIRLAETQELDYPLLAAYSDALRPSVFSLDAEREEIGPRSHRRPDHPLSDRSSPDRPRPRGLRPCGLSLAFGQRWLCRRRWRDLESVWHSLAAVASIGRDGFGLTQVSERTL